MKSTTVFLTSTATLFIFALYITTSAAVEYNGEYDVSAKDMAYLCSLINEYKVTGVKPIVADNTPPMPRETYMNDKTKCWKFTWHACSPSEIGKVKPCGWYEMGPEADDSMCS